MPRPRRYQHATSQTRDRQCQWCGAPRQDCTPQAPCCYSCTHSRPRRLKAEMRALEADLDATGLEDCGSDGIDADG